MQLFRRGKILIWVLCLLLWGCSRRPLSVISEVKSSAKIPQPTPTSPFDPNTQPYSQAPTGEMSADPTTPEPDYPLDSPSTSFCIAVMTPGQINATVDSNNLIIGTLPAGTVTIYSWANGVRVPSRLVAVHDYDQAAQISPWDTNLIADPISLNLAFKKGGSHSLSFDLITSQSSTTTCSASYAVNSISPSLSLLVNQGSSDLTLPFHSPVSIHWTATGVNQCSLYINNIFLSGYGSEGSYFSVLDVNSTIQVNCLLPNGQKLSSSRQINIAPGPMTNLTALNSEGPLSVSLADGEESNLLLSWSSNATVKSCSIKQDGTLLSTAISGSFNATIGKSIGNYTVLFQIVCTDEIGNSATDELAVYILRNSNNPPPNLNFTASSDVIPYGSQFSLSWSNLQGASTCSIFDGYGTIIKSADATNFGQSGSLSIDNLTKSANYFMTCTGTGGQTEKHLWVQVSDPTDHIGFVTSTAYTGNLGGLVGADAKCQQLAKAAGIRPERIWKSVLSDVSRNISAKSRIAILGPVYNNRTANGLTRQRISDDSLGDGTAVGFWEGNTSWLAALNYTENGSALSELSTDVWTGSTEYGETSTYGCASWTDSTSAHNGRAGMSSKSNEYRLHSGIPFCDHAKHIYCISQPGLAP